MNHVFRGHKSAKFAVELILPLRPPEKVGHEPENCPFNAGPDGSTVWVSV